MELTLEQLRQAAWGAVEIVQESGGIRFYRFTAEQRDMYRERAERFGFRSLATAGIKLVLRTDSPWLRLRVRQRERQLLRERLLRRRCNPLHPARLFCCWDRCPLLPKAEHYSAWLSSLQVR